jgi:hypothetical protein
VIAAALLMLAPAAALACTTGKTAQAAVTELSAATEKNPVKKRAVKKRAPKEEYMRAAPMPK